MTKSRKTTFEERVAIVKQTLEQNLSCAKAARMFGVSSWQVNSWINKYTQDGVESLRDGRGRKRKKKITPISDTQKLETEIYLLREKNRKLQMEIDFSKKLREIQNGR